MSFEQQFQDFIHRESLVNHQDSVLLAVSGGLDSMVMAVLFQLTSLTLGIAHVNHGLRGVESDTDESFIKEFAATHQIPFFSTRIPETYWSGKNLQQDARNFRYTFFNSIATQHGYSKIATAHHLNDQIETFFLHAARGSGLEGLNGISAKQNNIIRPLLFATRKAIFEYATKKNIPFREDSTNAKSIYTRNFVRHSIVPLIEQLPPGNLLGMTRTIDNLKKDNLLLLSLMDYWKQNHVRKEGEKVVVNLNDVSGFDPPENLLFHILASSGFNQTQCAEMTKAHAEPKQWLSRTHQVSLVGDKMTLMPRFRPGVHFSEIIFDSLSEQKLNLNEPFYLFEENKPTRIKGWVVDLEKLTFPLKIRNWKTTDVFRPLSMGGKRKTLKKIISERKVAVNERSQVRVLVNGDEEIIALLPGSLSYSFVKKYDGSGYLELLEHETSLLYPEKLL